jgi:hypothetical protein
VSARQERGVDFAEWLRDTISAIGAEHVAAAVLDSPWLARVRREAAAEAEVRVLRETADRLDNFVFPTGSDALEPMLRLVADLRHKADRIEEARDADNA